MKIRNFIPCWKIYISGYHYTICAKCYLITNLTTNFTFNKLILCDNGNKMKTDLLSRTLWTSKTVNRARVITLMDE